MTWPTDTEQIATINEQAERIHQLKDQVTRLQGAFRIACMIADDRRHPTPRTKYAPNMMGEDSLFEMGLQPTDLDPIE